MIVVFLDHTFVLTIHTQLSSETRGIHLGLSLRLPECASSEGSVETARIHKLACALSDHPYHDTTCPKVSSDITSAAYIQAHLRLIFYTGPNNMYPHQTAPFCLGPYC